MACYVYDPTQKLFTAALKQYTSFMLQMCYYLNLSIITCSFDDTVPTVIQDNVVKYMMLSKHMMSTVSFFFLIQYLHITMAMFLLRRPSLFLPDLPATFRRHDVMGITAAIKASSTLLNLLQLKGRTFNKLYTRRTFQTTVRPGSLCLMIDASNYPLISLKY